MESLHDFTKGKILGPLLKFAYPVFLALFLQAMYGAVDLLVVGKFATTADVSGVATGSQIMQSLTFVLTSFSIGITILLGQKIGEGKSELGGKVIGTGVALFAIIAAVCTVVFVAFTPEISALMQAPEEAFSQTVSYVRICSAGTIFIIAFNLLGSIFRGMGDSKMPLITVAIACVVNIFGDLLLVAVFKMGADGAAYATVLAQAVSVVLSLIIISRRAMPFAFSRADIRIDKDIALQLFKFGAPVALQELLVSLSFLVIFAIVNSLGLTQSAGVGVAEKICGFLMLVASAYSIDCILTAFLFCFCGYYSGCGRTTFTMVQGIAGAFLVRIPFSYFMSRIPGISLFYIGLATPASTVIQIALCLIYFVYTEKKIKKTEMAEA